MNNEILEDSRAECMWTCLAAILCCYYECRKKAGEREIKLGVFVLQLSVIFMSS